MADDRNELSSDEEFAKAVLESVGAKVEPVERSGDRTPDFQIWFGTVHYIVEVKTRTEDDDRARHRREALQRGDVAADSLELRRSNTISGIIADGVDQLDAFDGPVAFRVLWVHTDGMFSESYKLQFFNALYGSTRLYDFYDKQFKVDGLYFRDSDFFRYRDSLDAAVSTMQVGEVCKLFCYLNDQSPRFDAIRTSPLVNAFPERLYDPIVQEAAGEALIVRGDVNRGNAAAVLAHLHKLTGRRLHHADFTHATAIVSV